MSRIHETSLPGVGVRYDFETVDGQRVGVVHHRTGRREVFVCAAGDPDSVAVSVNLSEDEARSLVDALGGSQVVKSLSGLQQQIEGLAIDWLEVEPETRYAGRTIGDTHMRTRTGVSIVAVLRGEQPHPAPGPDFVIQPDDTLVVVGTAEGISSAAGILRTG